MRGPLGVLTVAVVLLADSMPVAVAASRTVHHAGNPYTIDVWETDDGLPQNSVIAMTQSRDGYLWLGTLNGLVRFDGVRFTVFDERNTPGLPSSRVVSLFEDSRSNLWVGTETAGVALVREGRITSLDIGRGSRQGRLMSACEDTSGAVWLYTWDGQLCRHRDGRVDVWNLGADSSANCRAIIPGESGSIWVGTDRRLFAIGPTAGLGPQELPATEAALVGKLDGLLASRRGGHWRLAGGHVQKWGTNGLERDWGPYPWSGVAVSAVCEGPEGELLVGTLGAGLFWFDAAGQVTRLSKEQGLSHNYILSLCTDREGSLWVGTDGGGLNRVKRQVFDVQEASEGLVVQSVCEDPRGALWIGYNASGIDRWHEGARERFRLRQGSTDLSIRSVFADRSGRVWAGTRGGGLFQYGDGQFQRAQGAEAMHPDIQVIHEDLRGQLWVGTVGGLARWEDPRWRVFTVRDGLPADAVQAVVDDAAGDLWVGTARSGLWRLHDGRFTPFRRQDGFLPSDHISALCVDPDGVLWVGTAEGLARFDGDRWTQYTTRDGLVSDSVGYLVDDGQGFLWIGSNAGLMRVRRQALNDFAPGRTGTLPVRAYGRPEGLPTRECTQGSQPAAWRGRSGRLWLPTIKGLASVDPAGIVANPHPPPVIIESVQIEGRLQNTNSLRTGSPAAVVMPAGRERLEISYTSLNLAAPDRARFRYRLEGHETSWTEAGNTRIARYPKLPPGHYRFQVTACNEDGVWNEAGSVLAVTVEPPPPPFWRTGWFLGASVAGFLGFLVATVHYFSTQRLRRQLEGLRQQQAVEKERARIARDIHDQLGANLTQVALLGELVESDKDSPNEVEDHARQISKTARDTTRALDEIVWAANPSNDSLDGLLTYFCKHAQDYLAVAALRCRLEVPSQLPGTPLPPEVRHNVFLAAKEALTNVVRHARASEVHIRLRLEPGLFVLEIQDDGRGPAGLDDPAAQLRNGMRNMRKRMEDIGGRFDITPATGGGTLVRLTGPLG